MKRSIYTKNQTSKSKKKSIGIILIIAALIAVSFYTQSNENSKQSHEVKTYSNTPAFNKKLYSINDPASIWVVVNKGRVLPSNYVPADLMNPSIPLRLSTGSEEMLIRKQAALALQSMNQAAGKQNVHFMLASGYRSYSFQVNLYAGYVRTQGQHSADISSARAGHSEHQTGFAADLEPVSRTCEVEVCFANTREGKWLAANAYKYGFIVRYPKSKENLTGYEYEPWHVRYIGTKLASQLYKNSQTMEQFFGLPNYTSYPASSYSLLSRK
jgi:D-alanyl-D-alanine carboxypeptidase